MNALAAARESVPPTQAPASWREAPLVWSMVSLSLAVLLHIGHVPPWVSISFAMLVAWRALLGVRRARLPGPLMRACAMIAIAASVYASFLTFNGLDAGTSLLVLMAGLKLLETRTIRDHVVLTLIAHVLVLAAFLHEQTWWLLPFCAVATWAATTTLLRVTQESPGAMSPGRSVRLAGRMLMQSVPLMIVLFLLFPRVPGPFWSLPSSDSGITGLGDEMSPGDISELSLSSEPAFRVRFHGPVPPPEERYWRGPVLRQFDGYTWRRARSFIPRSPVVFAGTAYTYSLMLEKSRSDWVYALDLPETWPGSQVTQRLDYQLVSLRPLDRPITLRLTSRTRYRSMDRAPRTVARQDTLLPVGRNQRSIALARNLRAQSSGPEDFSSRVLAMFREQPFEYTLTPQRLDFDSVDDFLFNTRSGFCGHYASAYTMLMRAGGVPARVVTGYQGAERNRVADYYIVRQSDAHAWSEIWLDGKGWTRVDPTAAVAPERVRRGLIDAMGTDEPVPDRVLRALPWLEDLRFTWDAITTAWRERIVEFGQDDQQSLLERLGFRNPDWRGLAILLVASLAVIIGVLAWQLRRELRSRPSDAVQKAYALFCRRLERRGLARQPHEGPRDFAQRVRTARPDLAPASDAIFSLYEALRYGCTPAAGALGELRSRVRQFHPPPGSRGA
jgi:transglutaminase-like putative cysteine protease